MIRKPAAIGDKVTFRKTMTVAEQAMFTGISGNLGGLYVDRPTAREGGLADMAVFEMAAASLLSTCLQRLSGPGLRIASITIDFDRSIPVGATVAATAELAAIDDGWQTYSLLLEVEGAVLSRGSAVLVPVTAR